MKATPTPTPETPVPSTDKALCVLNLGNFAMALVFQYGSNMSVARINDTKRLDGDAKTIGIASTVEP